MRWLLFLCCVQVGMWSRPAAAQDAPSVDLAEEADLQFRLGSDLYRKGDYEGALEHLLASNRLVPIIVTRKECGHLPISESLHRGRFSVVALGKKRGGFLHQAVHEECVHSLFNPRIERLTISYEAEDQR